MSNITEISTKQQISDAILHPDSRNLFRYWESIRGENSAADRKDIDLKQIKRILPWLAILERHPLKQEYHWRLSGTGADKIWKQELTGQTFMTNCDRFERDTVCRLLDNVIASHQPCVARFKATYGNDEMLGIELLALPVTAADGRTTQILATVVPFRTPYWFGEAELFCLELSSVKMIWTEHSARAPKRVPDVVPASLPATTAPLFRVIEGGLKN